MVIALSIIAAVTANFPPKKLSVDRSNMRLTAARVLSRRRPAESLAE